MKWMNKMTVETMELEWSAIKGKQRKKGHQGLSQSLALQKIEGVSKTEGETTVFQ